MKIDKKEYYRMQPYLQQMQDQILGLLMDVKQTFPDEPLNVHTWVKKVSPLGKDFWEKHGFKFLRSKHRGGYHRLIFSNVDYYQKHLGRENITDHLGIVINDFPSDGGMASVGTHPAVTIKFNENFLDNSKLMMESILAHEIHHLIGESEVIPMSGGKRDKLGFWLYWATPEEIEGNAKQLAYSVHQKFPNVVQASGNDLLDLIKKTYTDDLYMYAYMFDIYKVLAKPQKVIDYLNKEIENDDSLYRGNADKYKMWVQKSWIDFQKAFNFFLKLYRDTDLKQNPLSWDLTSYPESAFQKRQLSIFRKDKDKTNIIKRGLIKGRVGQYPRKGRNSEWLPGTNISVHNQKLDKNITRQIIIEIRTNYLEAFVKYGGKTCKDIVYIGDISSDPNEDFYTPFMMLHDIGEDLLEGRFNNAPRDNVIQRMVWNMSWEVVEKSIYYRTDNRDVYESSMLYIPKLVHTQPPALNTYKSWVTDAVFHDMVMETLQDGGFENYISELFALWCKRKKLTKAQFWNPKTVIFYMILFEKHGYKLLPYDEENEEYNKYIQSEVDRIYNLLPSFDKYLVDLNNLFEMWIRTLEGCILLQGYGLITPPEEN